jgi:hypothetical protein
MARASPPCPWRPCIQAVCKHEHLSRPFPSSLLLPTRSEPLPRLRGCTTVFPPSHCFSTPLRLSPLLLQPHGRERAMKYQNLPAVRQAHRTAHMSTSIRHGSGHYAPQWDVLVRYCTAPYTATLWCMNCFSFAVCSLTSFCPCIPRLLQVLHVFRD